MTVDSISPREIDVRSSPTSPEAVCDNLQQARLSMFRHSPLLNGTAFVTSLSQKHARFAIRDTERPIFIPTFHVISPDMRSAFTAHSPFVGLCSKTLNTWAFGHLEGQAPCLDRKKRKHVRDVAPGSSDVIIRCLRAEIVLRPI